MATEDTTFDWDDLIFCITDRRVIPIVGKELLLVSIDGEDVLLEHHLASRLAATLEVPTDQLSTEPTLNDVAIQHLRQGGDRRKIYSRLKAIVDELDLPVPKSLKKLASITDFNLYISLTFDSLLYQALIQERQGKQELQCLAFSTARGIEDLPVEVFRLKTSYVFHLLGKLSSTTDYAVTEEDCLEFIHALQSETRRPKLLFDELRNSHLLFLGCDFPNWLERFLIRTLTNERLLIPRDTSQFVADNQVRIDKSLRFFLQHYYAQIFIAGHPTQFVEELHTRWQEKNPATDLSKSVPTGNNVMEPGTIFLSYASQDRETVRNMKESLEKAGLDVWFDQGELLPGDVWDQEIQRNIRRCAVFIPFISHQTRQRLEGFFRKEWHWAIERDKGMDKSLRFIQPIVIDDTPDNAKRIPDYFWTKHCTRFPEGRPTADFVKELIKLVRKFREREAGYQ